MLYRILDITTTRRYGPLHWPFSSSYRGLRPSAKIFFTFEKEYFVVKVFAFLAKGREGKGREGEDSNINK